MWIKLPNCRWTTFLLLSNNSPSVLSFSHSTTALVEITEHIFTAIKIGQSYISGFQESFWQPTMILYVISCQHTVYHLTLSLGLGQSCQIANKILLLEALNLLFSLVLLGSIRHSPWPVIVFAVYHMNMHEKQSLHICRQHCQQMLQSHFKKNCEPPGKDHSWSAYGFISRHIKCSTSPSSSKLRLRASLLRVQFTFVLHIKLTSELWVNLWLLIKRILENSCNPGVRGRETRETPERGIWELSWLGCRCELLQCSWSLKVSFPFFWVVV